MSEISNDYVDSSTPPPPEDRDRDETEVSPPAEEPAFSPESDPDFYGNRGHNLSKDQIQQLINKVDGENRSNEKELLGMLQEAMDFLSDEDLSNDALAWEKYKDVSAQIGEEVDEGGENGEDSSAVKPTRVSHGVNYYEVKDPSKTLDLTAQETKGQNVVETEGTFILRTKNPEVPVKLTKEGDYVVATMIYDGKKEVYKIKAGKIHIASDLVNGKIENKDKKITVGRNEANLFISKSKIEEIATKLKNAPSKIGQGLSYGFGLYDANLRTVDSNGRTIVAAEVDVRALLPLVGEAIQEKDGKTKSEKWDLVLEKINFINTQEARKGSVNDRFQLLFNVLYMELGESGFQEALQWQLFPPGFANKVSELLTVEANENSSMDELRYQHGGPRWTHQTSADFLKQHSKNDTLLSDEEYQAQEELNSAAQGQ